MTSQTDDGGQLAGLSSRFASVEGRLARRIVEALAEIAASLGGEGCEDSQLRVRLALGELSSAWSLGERRAAERLSGGRCLDLAADLAEIADELHDRRRRVQAFALEGIEGRLVEALLLAERDPGAFRGTP